MTRHHCDELHVNYILSRGEAEPAANVLVGTNDIGDLFFYVYIDREINR